MQDPDDQPEELGEEDMFGEIPLAPVPQATPPPQSPRPVIPLPNHRPMFATPLRGQVDPSGRVASDVHCRECNYNLRTLPINGRCPECGRAVGFSLVGDLLRYCDPNWLGTLRSGANCILGSIAVIVLVFLVGFFTAMAHTYSLNIFLFSEAAGVASTILYFVGFFQLTKPDPSGLGEDQYGTSRRIIRFALAVGILNQAFNLAWRYMDVPYQMAVLRPIIGGLTSLIWLVGFIASFIYLSKIARRIPDADLENRARGLMWGMGIFFGVIIMLFVIARIAVTGGGGAFGVGCFACVGLIVFVVLGFMYTSMITRFANAFRDQENFARTSWAAGAVG